MKHGKDAWGLLERKHLSKGDKMKDNWVHRSDNMLCKTCIFYVPKRNGVIGRCRINAPTLKGWPVMFPTDWCGEHRLDDTKIKEAE